MKGRMEHQLVLIKRCEHMVSEMPEYVEDYYLSMKASNKEGTTCLAYLRKIKIFLDYIGNPKDILSITDKDVAKFLISITTKETDNGVEETSFSNRKQYHTILSSFFNYYVKTGKLVRSPMIAIERPKNTDNISHIKMESSDLKNILNQVSLDNKSPQWMKERNKTILKLFMDTGMRKAAMTEININDIDFENKELTIIDKIHKTHTYYLTDSMCIQLKKYIVERNNRENIKNNDALFISSVGTRISVVGVDDVVKKYTEKALGKPLSPHKLRSAYCTILYEKTGDIEFVREAVGHSNIATTQRYIAKDNSAKRKAAMIMEDSLS